MVFKWFASRPAEVFARELATFILSELQGSVGKRDAKFQARAEKILNRADGRVRDFKARESLNFWSKSKLANTFLWALKDEGCPDDYAKELAQWLTVRL
jgi:hypothetical protein